MTRNWWIPAAGMAVAMPRESLRTGLIVLAVFAAAAAEADSVLKVDQVSGHASRDRIGTSSPLTAGEALAERDIVHVGAGSHVVLDIGSNGFFELGPGSELDIEKLPYASYAQDLGTIINLSAGYLRVVWRRPQEGGNWPLFVYFGTQHASLDAGEYFFDRQDTSARICSAGGRVEVVPGAGEGALAPPANSCYRFVAGLVPEVEAREPESWLAVRRNFNIDAPASDEALLGQSDVVPAAAATREAPAAPPMPAPAPASVAAEPPPAPLRPLPPVLSAASLPPQDLAPAPNVSPAPATAAAGGPGWMVNVASVPDNDAANHLAQQLQGSGFPTAVRQVQVNGKFWFRVQVGAYGSFAEGQAAAAALKSRFGYAGLWITRQTP